VLSETELQRLSVTLDPGQTWRRPHVVRPTQAGENLRLAYFLYRDEAPADPDVRSADRYLQLWINVSTDV
jgi:uncharacterized membrane protein